MMKKIKYTLLLLCLSLGLMSNAQDYTMQYMRLSPYVNYYNPANFVAQKFYIGVPGLSNFTLNINNNWLIYNNLFRTQENGKPYELDINNFVNNMPASGNNLNFNLGFNVFDIGLRLGRISISAAYRMKMENNFMFSRDFMGLLVNGNLNYAGDGNEADVQLNINSMLYSELSVGLQIELTRRLYLGVRPKILNGIYDLHTNHIGFMLHTDAETYAMKISNFGADVNFASILPVDFNEGIPNAFLNTFNDLKEDYQNKIIDYKVLSNINRGVGLDLGFVYRLSDHLGVAGSITDLGYINWKSSGTNISAQYQDSLGNNTFEFEGFTYEQLTSMSSGDSIQINVLDYFPVTISDTNFNYTTNLVPTYMGEAYMQLGKSRLTGTVRKRGEVMSYTGALSINLINFINVCGTYTKLNYTEQPILGLGLEVKLGFVNVYAMTDNSVLALDPNSSLNIDNLNFKVGALVNFGTAKEMKIKVKDYDGDKKSRRKNKKDEETTIENEFIQEENKVVPNDGIEVYEPAKQGLENEDIFNQIIEEEAPSEDTDDIQIFEPTLTPVQDESETPVQDEIVPVEETPVVEPTAVEETPVVEPAPIENPAVSDSTSVF